jgi:cyclopropane-fatty-acyl-phospholipid synthase
MQLTDPSLYRKLFFNPELHAGEAYMDGRMTFPGTGLRAFLTLFSVNRLALSSQPVQHVLRSISRGLKRFQQANPIGKAQKNVAHHYDLGNAFYELFLDKELFYSCAYFRDEAETLEAAQINKCRLIAAKLCLKPGMKVLDIGSGWGGLARYLAKVADVEVMGVTLSKEQYALAVARTKEAGLEGRVKFALQDYRQLTTKFDRIVSVGMFEHVGPAHYADYFAAMARLLDRRGIALLHTIGRCDAPGPGNAWIEKYIFPGGVIPSLSQITAAIEGSGLMLTDVEVLRLHYAETLKAWRNRFAANRDQIRTLYDERFCRMWEFYLTGAEAGFREGTLVVFQLQLAKGRTIVPQTRDYISRLEQSAARIAAE